MAYKTAQVKPAVIYPKSALVIFICEEHLWLQETVNSLSFMLIDLISNFIMILSTILSNVVLINIYA